MPKKYTWPQELLDRIDWTKLNELDSCDVCGQAHYSIRVYIREDEEFTCISCGAHGHGNVYDENHANILVSEDATDATEEEVKKILHTWAEETHPDSLMLTKQIRANTSMILEQLGDLAEEHPALDSPDAMENLLAIKKNTDSTIAALFRINA